MPAAAAGSSHVQPHMIPTLDPSVSIAILATISLHIATHNTLGALDIHHASSVVCGLKGEM